MSTLKKILSLSLALAMLMSVSVFAGFADAAEIDEKAAAAVELLTAVKILNGFPVGDGTFEFRPTDTILREQAAKMIYVLRNGGVDDGAETWKAAVSFDDVAKDNWAAGYIAYCETYGIIDGMTDTMFAPDKPLTGVQLAKLLLTVAGYKGDVEGYTGTGYEKNVIADANEAGLFAGVKDVISGPITRQYAAVMFQNAFNVKIPTYIGDYRIDGILGNEEDADTVASKFLNYNDKRVTVVLATETASVNGTFAKKGEVILADGTETFAVADALVGQEVKVTTINDKIVTIAATGKTVAGVLSATAHTGDDAGKYTVKVGTTTVLDKKADAVVFEDLKASDIVAMQNKKGAKTVYVAYDNKETANDYVVETTTTYGDVSYNSTTKAYTIGTFVIDKDGKNDGKVVAVVGDLSKAVVAKVIYDELTGKNTVEVVTGKTGKFTNMDNGKTKFTVDGVVYEYAVDNLEDKNDLYLADYTKMNKDVVLYTEGKYIYKATAPKAADAPATEKPTTLPEQLAYLIDGASVVIEESKTDEWGRPVDSDNFDYKYLVKLMVKAGAIDKPFELENDEETLAKIKYDYWTVGDLFEDGELKAEYKGIVFEYDLSTNGNIILKKGFADIKDAHFYVNGKVEQTVEDNEDMGLSANYKTNTMFGDTLIRGTENTVVFAKYTNNKGVESFKTIKLADLLAKDVKVTTTKVLAATDGAIGEALLVVVDYEYNKPADGEPEEVDSYIKVVSAPEYVIGADGKIYKTFKAIDLNKAGDAVLYTMKADSEVAIASGTIYKITTKDGLVDEAESETWISGAITARVADLLLVKYTKDEEAKLVENTEEYFAKTCKIIVENDNAYAVGDFNSLKEATQKADKSFELNIQYVVNDKGAFTYIIIDLDKTK